MSNFIAELLKIFFFTLLTGFFAGSEMALISARKTRIEELAKQGNKRAKIVKLLQEDPEKFIATAQIGISVVTIVASVIAGANLSDEIKPWFEHSGIAFLSSNAGSISYFLIISLVAYFTIVIGELIPKSLALRYSEQVSLAAAYPIYFISKLCGFLIWFLTASSNIMLKPFKDSTSFSESVLSEDEIRNMLREGRIAGTIERREHEILENVFEFTDMTVGKIMTPTAQITAFDIDNQVQLTVTRVIESEYSRIPFFKDKLDNIIGVLHIKDLLEAIDKSKGDYSQINIREMLSNVMFVPNTQKIMSVLHKFQKNKTHLAIVTDEHGDVDGLITLEDILEEIVGDIADETDENKLQIRKQENGNFLVEGNTSVIDFNKFFKTNLPEDEQYTTVSGFILEELGRFPETSDVVRHGSLDFMIKEKTNRTVKLVEISNRKTAI